MDVIVDFDFVWEKHEKELSNFVKSRLYDKSMAKDIMQEIAIKIYKNKTNLANIDNTRAWTYRIARNTLVDFYKKNDKAIPDELFTIENTLYEDDKSDKSLEICINNIAKTLKKSDKDIIDLSIVQQYRVEEISKKFGLSQNGTKSKLKRAKKKLANKFFSCCVLEKDIQGKIVDFKAINDKKCEC